MAILPTDETLLEIKVEILTVKASLERLTFDQDKLIQLEIKSQGTEKFLTRLEKANDKLFSNVRDLEQIQVAARLKALEGHWKVVLGGFMTIICGVVLLFMRQEL